MIVLHEHNSHYDLIIPNDSRLALDGGLDYQRNEKEKARIDDEKQDEETPSPNLMEGRIDNLEEKARIDDEQQDEEVPSPNSMEERIDNLEKKLTCLQNRCDLLERENKDLVKEITENRKKAENDDSLVEEETLVNLKKSGVKRPNPQVQPELKSKQIEFSCEKCDCKLVSFGLLNAHMETHMSTPVQKCGRCAKEFKDEQKLKNHTKLEHADKLRQFTCEDCPFQGESSLELKKHVLRTQHIPSEYKESCYTCKEEFKNYFHLMNHRKKEHPSTKVCRFFLKQACIFEADEC